MFCIKATKEKAMSNETGLDWMARNVHNWPAGHQGWCYVISNRDGTKGVATSLIGQVDCPWVRIEKQEWLARRAELQNKPSWDDFGESAKFMAQDSDGAWMAFESEPAANYHVWSSTRGWCGYAREGRDRCRGEVLGDWRDTLEKRPDMYKNKKEIDTSSECVQKTSESAYEFEPFVSVEDAATAKHATITPSKYTKTIHGVPVDVYDVLQAWGVSNPALQHLIKKALQCGQRGHKDNAQDLQDIIDSAIRAKELG